MQTLKRFWIKWCHYFFNYSIWILLTKSKSLLEKLKWEFFLNSKMAKPEVFIIYWSEKMTTISGHATNWNSWCCQNLKPKCRTQGTSKHLDLKRKENTRLWTYNPNKLGNSLYNNYGGREMLTKPEAHTTEATTQLSNRSRTEQNRFRDLYLGRQTNIVIKCKLKFESEPKKQSYTKAILLSPPGGLRTPPK